MTWRSFVLFATSLCGGLTVSPSATTAPTGPTSGAPILKLSIRKVNHNVLDGSTPDMAGIKYGVEGGEVLRIVTGGCTCLHLSSSAIRTGSPIALRIGRATTVLFGIGIQGGRKKVITTNRARGKSRTISIRQSCRMRERATGTCSMWPTASRRRRRSM